MESGGIQGEEEEGQDAKVACKPCMPTEEEVEKYNATHIPFRSWCPYCVAGKAKCNPHFKKEFFATRWVKKEGSHIKAFVSEMVQAIFMLTGACFKGVTYS